MALFQLRSYSGSPTTLAASRSVMMSPGTLAPTTMLPFALLSVHPSPSRYCGAMPVTMALSTRPSRSATAEAEAAASAAAARRRAAAIIAAVAERQREFDGRG